MYLIISDEALHGLTHYGVITDHERSMFKNSLQMIYHCSNLFKVMNEHTGTSKFLLPITTDPHKSK